MSQNLLVYEDLRVGLELAKLARSRLPKEDLSDADHVLVASYVDGALAGEELARFRAEVERRAQLEMAVQELEIALGNRGPYTVSPEEVAEVIKVMLDNPEELTFDVVSEILPAEETKDYKKWRSRFELIYKNVDKDLLGKEQGPVSDDYIPTRAAAFAADLSTDIRTIMIKLSSEIIVSLSRELSKEHTIEGLIDAMVKCESDWLDTNINPTYMGTIFEHVRHIMYSYINVI